MPFQNGENKWEKKTKQTQHYIVETDFIISVYIHVQIFVGQIIYQRQQFERTWGHCYHGQRYMSAMNLAFVCQTQRVTAASWWKITEYMHIINEAWHDSGKLIITSECLHSSTCKTRDRKIKWCHYLLQTINILAAKNETLGLVTGCSLLALCIPRMKIWCL